MEGRSVVGYGYGTAEAGRPGGGNGGLNKDGQVQQGQAVKVFPFFFRNTAGYCVDLMNSQGFGSPYIYIYMKLYECINK